MSKAPRGHWRHRFATEAVYNWTNWKWCTINQRTINGEYATGLAASKNPQQQSYLKQGIKIEISKEDFYDFCSDNEQKILEMMNNGERPSIDRIDIKGDYTLENIQVIPLMKNLTKDRAGNPSESRVGDPMVRLGNRKVYLATHPDTKDIRFSDKLLEVDKPMYILRAVGVWDSRLDEPYDTESEHYGFYLEVLGKLLEGVSARKAMKDMEQSIRLRKAAEKLKKLANSSHVQAYHKLKAWAKACPEYASIYLNNQRLGSQGHLDQTAQRQTMDDLKALYESRGEFPSDLLQ